MEFVVEPRVRLSRTQKLKRILHLFSIAALFLFATTIFRPVATSPYAYGAVVPGPGGLFVAGQKVDLRAGPANFGVSPDFNLPAAQRLIRLAVTYVTHGNPAPHMLYVGHANANGQQGMKNAGFLLFDVAGDQAAPGVRDLQTVDFKNYDVVVIASTEPDLAGVPQGLQGSEIGILAQRRQELLDFISGGGGLVAFEEDKGPAFGGGQFPNAFDFLPFLEVAPLTNQGFSSPGGITIPRYRVTPEGRAAGITEEDIQFAAGQQFGCTAGMDVFYFEQDGVAPEGEILSLATRNVTAQTPLPAAPSSGACEKVGLTIGNAPPVKEGNSGATDAVFPVSLSAPNAQAVTVNYSTQDGTATGGQDYERKSGSFTVPAGATTASLKIPVLGDTLPEPNETFPEPNETFSVKLSSPSNATLLQASATATIIGDDEAPGQPSPPAGGPVALPGLSIIDVRVKEGNTGTTTALFPVTLNAPLAVPISVRYATEEGTAKAGKDFTAAAGDLKILPGATSASIPVLVLPNALLQPDRSFFVNLSSAAGAAIVRSKAQATIVDDDGTPPPSRDAPRDAAAAPPSTQGRPAPAHFGGAEGQAQQILPGQQVHPAGQLHIQQQAQQMHQTANQIQPAAFIQEEIQREVETARADGAKGQKMWLAMSVVGLFTAGIALRPRNANAGTLAFGTRYTPRADSGRAGHRAGPRHRSP